MNSLTLRVFSFPLFLRRTSTLEDVKHVIFSMSSYKAPRVDGFQLICLETYWEVVAIDVWTMVSNAFSIGTFDPGQTTFNCTYSSFRSVSWCTDQASFFCKIWDTQRQTQYFFWKLFPLSLRGDIRILEHVLYNCINSFVILCTCKGC